MYVVKKAPPIVIHAGDGKPAHAATVEALKETLIQHRSHALGADKLLIEKQGFHRDQYPGQAANVNSLVNVTLAHSNNLLLHEQKQQIQHMNTKLTSLEKTLQSIEAALEKIEGDVAAL